VGRGRGEVAGNNAGEGRVLEAGGWGWRAVEVYCRRGVGGVAVAKWRETGDSTGSQHFMDYIHVKIKVPHFLIYHL